MEIEILVKKKENSLTASLIRYQIQTSTIPDFSLAEDEERECLFRLRTKYRKTVEGYKNIENDFYSHDSPNDDLENKILKGSWIFNQGNPSCFLKRKKIVFFVTAVWRSKLIIWFGMCSGRDPLKQQINRVTDQGH